jgi:hypothetical protein
VADSIGVHLSLKFDHPPRNGFLSPSTIHRLPGVQRHRVAPPSFFLLVSALGVQRHLVCRLPHWSNPTPHSLLKPFFGCRFRTIGLSVSFIFPFSVSLYLSLIPPALPLRSHAPSLRVTLSNVRRIWRKYHIPHARFIDLTVIF